MDKRSLTFLIILTLALFGVGQYFNYQRSLEIKKYQEELEAWVAPRLAEPTELPLVDLYETKDAEFADGTAVLMGNQVIVVSEQPRDRVFVRAKGSSKPVRELALQKSGAGVSLYGSAEVDLVLPQLQREKREDVQLVWALDSSEPLVSFGQTHQGELAIPLDRPTTRAIALLKTEAGYQPFGVWEPATRQFLTLDRALEVVAKHTERPVSDFPVTAKTADQQYYVLENEFVQLVFSNVGGALAEINLPFPSEDNENSIVREIEFDRHLEEYHQEHAQFPAHEYMTASGETKKGVLGGYYPLLRRSTSKDARGHNVQLDPSLYAFNVVSEYPEVANLTYEVKSFTAKSITLEARQRHRKITKTFTLIDNETYAPYCFNVTVAVEGDSRGLWLTSGVPEVEWISGASTPDLKYRMQRQGVWEVEKMNLPTDVDTVTSISPDWVSNSNGFLGVIIDPLTGVGAGYKAQYVSGTQAPTRLLEIDEEHQKFQAERLPGYQLMLPLNSGGGTMQFRAYTGPFAETVLKQVDAAFVNPQTGETPGYLESRTFRGYFAFILDPFGKLLFILMNMFHSLTGSWAFSIILLTVVLRMMLYPLNAWSMKSMRRMQEIAPHVSAIQAKHKKDPAKAQAEIMNLYKEKGVNPMMGCFPMLIQMPFLFAMFNVLRSTFELRGASFIPGWIDNLASPDVIFSWNTPLIYIGNELHLLPILLGLVMFVQQRLSSTIPKDKSKLTEQQAQQKMMGNMMTGVFAIMFYHFPSGLNLYWLSSMTLGILQQWFVNKQLGQESAVAAPAK